MRYFIGLVLLFFSFQGTLANSIDITGSLAVADDERILEVYEDVIKRIAGAEQINDLAIYDKSFGALTLHRTFGNVIGMAAGVAPRIINDVDHYNVDASIIKVVNNAEVEFRLECSSANELLSSF